MANELDNANIRTIVKEIKTVLEEARSNVAKQVNNELLNSYWNIGRIIVEYEQTVPERADYGKQTLKELSKKRQARVTTPIMRNWYTKVTAPAVLQ